MGGAREGGEGGLVQDMRYYTKVVLQLYMYEPSPALYAHGCFFFVGGQRYAYTQLKLHHHYPKQNPGPPNQAYYPIKLPKIYPKTFWEVTCEQKMLIGPPSTLTCSAIVDRIKGSHRRMLSKLVEKKTGVPH